MIPIVRTGNPELRARLNTHPRVASVEDGDSSWLAFDRGDWPRSLTTGDPTVLYGLPELMDNNPLVCADKVSAPSPLATLALIALGPLIDAGIIEGDPVLMLNGPLPTDDVVAGLATTGFDRSVTLSWTADEAPDVLALAALIPIRTPDDLAEIDHLYEERYGRAYYVRLLPDAEWTPDLVRDQPWAAVQLRITVDEPTSLLTVRVLADRDGKAGSAQLVHLFNIMNGFEETLGIV